MILLHSRLIPFVESRRKSATHTPRSSALILIVYLCSAAAAFIAFLISTPLSAQVTLSEIMFNPPGNENHNEFIEIYNMGNQPADLSGWSISDSAGTDFITGTGAGTILNPEQYGIVLDPDYFSNSTLYDSLIPADALVLTIDGPTFGSRGMSNSRPETIMLTSASGDTISRYTYAPDNDDGISDEKILLSGPDSFSNWGCSEHFAGTPGSRNSLTPPDYDPQLTRFTISPTFTMINKPVVLEFCIRNAGQYTPDSAFLEIFLDDNANGTGENDELMDVTEIDVKGISNFRDTTAFRLEWSPSYAGEMAIIAVLKAAPDDDTSNNSAAGILGVLAAKSSIIINEIMYYPFEDTPEWIEIRNCGSIPVSLRSWILCDEAGNNNAEITTGSYELPRNGYAVITSDSSALARSYSHSFQIIPMERFPALNNSGDRIMLIDPTGKTVEEVMYDNSWGYRRNVSLERIDPASSANRKSNWALCTAPEGATPGLPNTLQPVDAGSAAAIHIDPETFGPGSSKCDYCTMQVTLPFTLSHVTMDIFDKYGRQIKSIIRGEPRGGMFSETWDGKNNSGSLMPTGLYIVCMSAISSETGRKIEYKTTVVLIR